MKKFNPDEISRLIRNRRSVYPKFYTGEKIDDSIIHEILENANWAPTHKLTQPWRFSVFTGEGLKKLGGFMSELYKVVAGKDNTFLEEKFKMLRSKPLLASHVISIGMKRDDKGVVPEIEEVEAVASAVQNMYLTAAAHGVGCYWGSGGVTYFEEAKPFFGLGKQDKLLGFMFFGIPKEINYRSKRTPIEDKVTWVRA